MSSKFKTFFRRKTNASISAICASTIICKDYIEFFKLWGWDKEPNLSYLPTLAYRYPEDLNDRELRDAETLMSLCCNTVNAAALEIGTSTGLTTLGMALNAPDATIYTVDIPRSEAVSGKGGTLITHILEPESVGIITGRLRLLMCSKYLLIQLHGNLIYLPLTLPLLMDAMTGRLCIRIHSKCFLSLSLVDLSRGMMQTRCSRLYFHGLVKFVLP